MFFLDAERDSPGSCVDIGGIGMADIEEQFVFLVDDEPEVRRAVGKTLEQIGLNVKCFDCGPDCLEDLTSQRCDLLIADLKMPGMDGMELLRQAKVVAPWVPVLIVTGYGDVPTAVAAIKAGAVDFVEKPLDKSSFVRKVKAALPANGNRKYLGRPLTQSEETVLRLVLDSKSNREIAGLLSRSVRTVEVHRAHIMGKLGADNLVDLLKRAAAMGLVQTSLDL
jgi:FixJ family two-component response regulator